MTEEDILLREEWDALAAANPDRLKLVYALDKPPAVWSGVSGFVTPEVIEGEALPPSAHEGVKVFCCGPPPMYEAICGPKDATGKQGEVGGALKKLGYTSEQVFKF